MVSWMVKLAGNTGLKGQGLSNIVSSERTEDAKSLERKHTHLVPIASSIQPFLSAESQHQLTLRFVK
jgi:hypothetical protein